MDQQATVADDVNLIIEGHIIWLKSSKYLLKILLKSEAHRAIMDNNFPAR